MNLILTDFLHMTKKISAWKLGETMCDIYINSASITKQ